MKEARTAFICYDEPGFNAVFGLTLETESAYASLSNGLAGLPVEM